MFPGVFGVPPMPTYVGRLPDQQTEHRRLLNQRQGHLLAFPMTEAEGTSQVV